MTSQHTSRTLRPRFCASTLGAGSFEWAGTGLAPNHQEGMQTEKPHTCFATWQLPPWHTVIKNGGYYFQVQWPTVFKQHIQDIEHSDHKIAGVPVKVLKTPANSGQIFPWKFLTGLYPAINSCQLVYPIACGPFSSHGFTNSYLNDIDQTVCKLIQDICINLLKWRVKHCNHCEPFSWSPYIGDILKTAAFQLHKWNFPLLSKCPRSDSPPYSLGTSGCGTSV